MKKCTIILLAMVLYGFAGFSQTVNNVPVRDIDVEFIDIVGSSRVLSTKINVEIDFGQENTLVGNKPLTILDENNKKMIFNSMMEALNFMSKNGYEFVQAYVIQDDTGSERHFLMRKRKMEMPDLKANMDT